MRRLIAWRHRHNEDGLRPFDEATDGDMVPVRATGFGIGSRWFLGLMGYRPIRASEVTFYPELVVFGSRPHMESAGFDRSGRHRVYEHIRGWCQGLGAGGLMQRTIQRVTIHPSARETIFGHLPGEGWLRDVLKSRQATWGEAAVWVEL